MRGRMVALVVAVFAVMFLCVAAPPASAQIIQNPNIVMFDHADFATAASYQIAYHFLAVTNNTCGALSTASATAAYTDTVAKPTTTTGVGMTVNLVTKPIGCYVVKVRALDASGLYAPWSVASTNAGERDPSSAANVVVK